MPKPIHLNLFIQSRGHHETAWDHPGADPRSLMDISYYVDLAQQAEAARFDSIFFADVLSRKCIVIHESLGPRTWQWARRL